MFLFEEQAGSDIDVLKAVFVTQSVIDRLKEEFEILIKQKDEEIDELNSLLISRDETNKELQEELACCQAELNEAQEELHWLGSWR